ncbi:DUF6118 family protein [Sphingopyxis witflariensis]|uniref:Uncharacterized protein n=1 Tax=Sphingopyxis witflariensis TaxID=173675 RepID=A0A246K3P1_9SPHN|nr:DUF6118 family protein [Sphingopyxis witflariensis]OWR00216.1 hypothetical protein CDQ91_05495 [Sphingopyxis witflariensis]
MGKDVRTSDDQDPAAAAFSRLEGEIALMRRAVGQLTTGKVKNDAPDYTLTLGEMSKRLGAIEEKPAMLITPEDMATRMAAAATEARRTDRTTLTDAQQKHDQAAYRLEVLLGTATTIAKQRGYIIWAGGGGLLAGCLLWAILPGAFARALPESWHVPERMAAHVAGGPTVWEAGVRIMRAGSPEAYRAIAAAAEMRHQNRDVIAACEKSAARRKKAVRCTIEIEHSASVTDQ